MTLERIILKNLIANRDYLTRVLPFLEDAYFRDIQDQRIFTIIRDNTLQYGNAPTLDEIEAEIINGKGSDEFIKTCSKILVDIKNNVTNNNMDWLIDNTEQFVQSRAIHLAMLQGVRILEGRDKNHTPAIIPDLLQQALSITFDPNIGHDYTEDFKHRFDHYTNPKKRIPFDLDMLNKITKGGLPEKTFSVLLAGIHVGKTLGMCHMAAGFLNAGYNVLYITLEMAEEEIGKRIDANLMNVSIEDIENLPYAEFEKRANVLKSKTVGKLFIKEYPTGAASVAHFRALLNELKLKKGFKPDVIFIDYINICASARIKAGAGLYEYVKSIGEEFRGLAVEFVTRVITATQLKRDGYNSSDPDMTDTAESWGLPAIADFMLAFVTNEELEKLGQLAVIQLKNRIGGNKKFKRFLIGIDYIKQRLYDVMNNSTPTQTSTPAVPNAGMKTNKFKGITA